LLIGPWLHSGEVPPGDDFDWGPEAEVDFMPLFLRWFDAWLLGADNGTLEDPMVKVFAIGPNRWLEADSYPLRGTSQVKLFLTSAGGANTSGGDGALHFHEPDASPEYDSYVYDPADPTPSLWYEELAGYDATVRSREDILVYETEPLTDSLLVMGPVSLRLYASSSAKDTDWVAYWRIIDEQGEQVPMGRGTLRARFRNSPRHPELLREHQIYEYTLDLWHMGMLIEKGWRIRLEIASACFPAFSRNLNTGGGNETETEYVTAEQRVFHSHSYSSHLLLPVVDLTQSR
jgi:putative CocE/NonD family hydrolase